MSLNYKQIGLRVKGIRMHKQMSQAELAEKIEMSESYISHIETARKQASLKSLDRIASILGVTVDHFLNGNHTNDLAEYWTDMARLIADCTSYEKRVIFDVVSATKKSLREHK